MSITHSQAIALRHADALCFDLNTETGGSAIRAILRATDDTSEVTTTIPADQSYVERYDGSSGGMAGFHSEMYVKHDGAMQTLLHDLATIGAQFALYWVRGNSSPVLDEAGLVCDELRIAVQKKGVSRTRMYRVAKQVGRDNSARMIRLV